MNQMRRDPDFLQIVRQNTIVVDNNPSLMTSIREKKMDDIRSKLKNEFIKSFRVSEQEDCGICLMPFEKPCNVSVLKCSEKHYFHDYCIKGLIDYRKNNSSFKAKCPLCRKEIDESGIVTRPYGGLEQTELNDIKITEKPSENIKDMFALKDP